MKKINKNRVLFFIFNLILGLNMSFPALALEEDSIPENVVSIKEDSLSFSEKGELQFQVDVADGYFSYLEKFKLEISDLQIKDLKFDPVVTFFDKTFNKNKKGVRNLTPASAKYTIQKSADLKSGDLLNVTLSYQACTPEYCLFPTTTEFKYTITKADAKLLGKNNSPGWLSGGIFYALIFVFFTGLLTSLTPCVYPLIPITLAVLGREKADTKLKGFSKSLIYVLGMASTYSGLGILAATSGFMFGSLLSNTYFVGFLGLILFLAALSMFDLFEIKAPAFLNKGGSGKKKSLLGIFISGAFSGLVVGPCVGPVLVGILSYVSTSGDVLKGFLFLFTFALGLGSLIIVLGTFSGLIDKLPKSGNWMVWVKKGLGFVFILMIAYFFAPLLDVRSLVLLMSFVFFVFSLLMVYKYKKNDSGATKLEKALFKALLFFSCVVAGLSLTLNNERFERLVGYSDSTYINSQWEIFSEEKLSQAKTNEEIVILDFYADWCAACKELKHITFADKRVLEYKKEGRKIRWLYFDATKPTKLLTQYKEKYKILGLPTILIFDSTGEQRADLTLTGFEGPEDFLKRLDKL